MKRKCERCGAMQVETVDFNDEYLDVCVCCGYTTNRIVKKDFLNSFECPDCGSFSGKIEENAIKLGIRCDGCGKLHIMLEKHSDADLRSNQISNQTYTTQNVPNIPKCPTCQSTHIQKISAGRKLLGGLGFGLMSKTATSQFECKNCGYKW